MAKKDLRRHIAERGKTVQVLNPPSAQRSIGRGIAFILLCIILVLSAPLIVAVTFFQGLWVNAHPAWYLLPIILMFSCSASIILSLILGLQNLRKKYIKQGYYIAFAASITVVAVSFFAAVSTL